MQPGQHTSVEVWLNWETAQSNFEKLLRNHFLHRFVTRLVYTFNLCVGNAFFVVRICKHVFFWRSFGGVNIQIHYPLNVRWTVALALSALWIGALQKKIIHTPCYRFGSWLHHFRKKHLFVIDFSVCFSRCGWIRFRMYHLPTTSHPCQCCKTTCLGSFPPPCKEFHDEETNWACFVYLVPTSWGFAICGIFTNDPILSLLKNDDVEVYLEVLRLRKSLP